MASLNFVLPIAVCVTVLVSLVSGTVPWEAETRDANWMHHHEALLNQTKHHAAEVKAVFLGDSITQGWGGNGKQLWHEHYESRHAFNYGIGGDGTQHILWRIANGEFEGVKPKVIVLMIGTNNITRKDGNATAIAKGIQAISDALYAKMPDAKLLLLSVLPRSTTAFDTEVHDINKLISRFADNKRVHYLDLAVHFEVSVAHVITELYVPDHVHLSAKGYEMWYKVMEPLFASLIA